MTIYTAYVYGWSGGIPMDTFLLGIYSTEEKAKEAVDTYIAANPFDSDGNEWDWGVNAEELDSFTELTKEQM